MRLDNTARTFDSNATLENNAFKIQASAKAFQVLSDQLYNDKPLAILRELGANAYDSHVANGNPEVPFEVHLPTTLNPELIITDFGTGLSPIMVRTLYTTYFGSDKTHTNELIGGLGLGSKSPFSYTDQFTVISRHGGVATTYLAYIDDTGIPAITEVSSQPMQPDQLTGLTITLPIKDSDHTAFQRAAVKALSYIKTTPKINRDVDLTITHSSTVLELDDLTLKIREKDRDYENDYYMQRYMPNGMRIIMGGVYYPVDYTKFTESRHYSLAQKPIDIFAPIGWVDFVASREGLAYSKPTVAKLTRMMEDVDSRLQANMLDLVSKATTLVEATKIRNDFYHTLGVESMSVTWNTFEVFAKIKIGRLFDGKIRVISRPWRDGGKKKFASEFANPLTLSWDPKAVLMWRPKETPLQAYFQDNPPERGRPYILFTGSEQSVKDYFADTGLFPEEMPAQPKKKRGERAKLDTSKQYQASVYITLGEERHTDLSYWISREDIATALTDTDAQVFLNSDGAQSQDILLNYDSRLAGKDVIFVEVPQHHSRIIKTLTDLGAINVRGKPLSRLSSLLPEDKTRMLDDIRTRKILLKVDSNSVLSDACQSIRVFSVSDSKLPDDMKELLEIQQLLRDGISQTNRYLEFIPHIVYSQDIGQDAISAVADELSTWIDNQVKALRTKYAPMNFKGRYYIENDLQHAMFEAFINQCNNKEHATA